MRIYYPKVTQTNCKCPVVNIPFVKCPAVNINLLAKKKYLWQGKNCAIFYVYEKLFFIFFAAILVSILPLYVKKLHQKIQALTKEKKAQTNVLQNISNKNNAKIPRRLLL